MVLAEEAFSAVMKMDPKFEKANEIYFRLGIIYKQQQKYDLSLQVYIYIYVYICIVHSI
jgi:glucose repression mediator protein